MFKKKGDIVTYKRDPGSLYMVIERYKDKLFVIGTNSRGEIFYNDDEFAELGKTDIAPNPNIRNYKKIKTEYEKGSFFDYLHKTIVENTMDIKEDNNQFKELLGFALIDMGIRLDPRDNTYEHFYTGNFVEKKGENNNGI